MFITKVLEKKGVIQSFGVALILAPFVNTLTRLFISHAASERTFSLYWRYLTTKPMFLQILALLTIANGILMLRGQRSAWRFTLVVLGAYIAHQVLNFGPNFRESWVAALYLGINILAFAFIVDQLVWKVEAPVRKTVAVPPPKVTAVPASQQPPQKPPQPATTKEPVVATVTALRQNPPEKDPTPTPAKVTPLRAVKSFQSKKRILISFDEQDPWAQITAISSVGFKVKCLLNEPPSGIENREVEFKLKNGLLLKARLTDKKNDQYLFKYTNATQTDISRLNQWLRDIA